MPYIQIQLNLEKELYDELHRVMAMKLKDSDGLIVHETYSGKSFAQWYRDVMKAGLLSKRNDFQVHRIKIEAEHH